MTRLHMLFDQQGQSPWLDHLDRSGLRSGRFGSHVRAGVRGVASVAVAAERDPAALSVYDPQIESLTRSHLSTEDIYWELVIADVIEALALLKPVHDRSEGADGFVSIGVPPVLAHDINGIAVTARSLRQQIDYPNLLIAIPATDVGISAIRQVTAEGISTDATQIYCLSRYKQVIDAYMSGLETCPLNLSAVNSVASFSLCDLDNKVDARLMRIGDTAVPDLIGRAACYHAKQAYRIFAEAFSSLRWKAIAERRANVQRPIWISTPRRHDAGPGALRYVEPLIGPNTIVAMSEPTVSAFQTNGATFTRTLDRDIEDATKMLDRFAAVGIHVEDLSAELEAEALAETARTYERSLAALGAKAALLSNRKCH